MDILGHEKIVNFFDKVLENGRFGHAYLFVGPESLGKKAVAMQIASKLLNSSVENLHKEFGFSFVEQEIDQKTGKTKKGISIDQIRDLINFLSQKSFVKGYKIAIINNAHKMSSITSNALLKTLEEPKGETVLFLITENLDELPSTIISRCQIVHFEPIEQDIIFNYLLELKIDKEKAKEIAELSLGLPGKAIDFVENSGKFDFYKKEIERFESMFGKPFYEKRACVEEIFGNKTDHIAQRDEIRHILSVWQFILSSFLKNACSVKSGLTYDSYIKLNDSISEAKNLISFNIHPRLLIENILLLIP
ncbi:MAG: hypothetical protein CO137_02710 [Candidatus Magasanikbacteria bacterium CG_4_9_14_3_um_filter_32_9]|uniref:DNA polymerase III subunit delta n=1 Tax=Candidatus Magasanikbacteria bacterium CG_4_9_14_3_um_filter_32_9 TaxID=1974644 RepID=A0A2M7Z6L5_9BACT|nr:MAG: hypothetical protein CO137_02710 [Candidatus Magasanikbacteria bacterium CG_4_9_14_3_um_filter_32_9]